MSVEDQLRSLGYTVRPAALPRGYPWVVSPARKVVLISSSVTPATRRRIMKAVLTAARRG
jgi:hypothetical protein